MLAALLIGDKHRTQYKIDIPGVEVIIWGEADLYVCLSESETCPMVFLEAQLFNLPIVNTYFPSANEFIDNESGKIFQIENIPNDIVYII